MTSLAAVHTAAALIVRALGDAGLSAEVALTIDTTGIVVRPKPGIETRDWVMAVRVIAAETHGGGHDLDCLGYVDDVPVRAQWESPRRVEVVA